MEKKQRNKLQKATQDSRRLLEEEFRSQLLQTYDIDVEKVRWEEEPGAHLQAEQRLIREKLIAWIEHKEAQINDRKEALLLALREMAFTALNRFVALKLMEARELVRPCVSSGLESAGFQEFTAVAQGLLAEQESSYRLFLETIFEDLSRELRALFDPRDPSSLLWPKRTGLLELLEILNHPELAELWSEDETLGWVYQYFNGDDERKKMRKESSAPRNSRELAVRNQFFTPRYVVEFLTDNTLGRIWYEMRQGDTGLKDRCRYLVRRPNEIWLHPGEEAPALSDSDKAVSQEELLQQPVHIPHRPLKDPREIRMLDPACGSMHFGLYSFELYLEIYAEAWEISQASVDQLNIENSFSAFVSYAAGFDSKAAFLREVPKQILQHNIHGIDIDPRATQIARLTLWLRAQRAWKEQQLPTADRPVITRSNVVCAEPMPGERALLADFVDNQFPVTERILLRDLMDSIFDKMQIAGVAGSLLKIEDEIRDAIDKSRMEWQKFAVRQKDLFSAAQTAELWEENSSPNTGLPNLTEDFWIDIEDRVYDALNNFALLAEASGGFQRRLFAEDAAQGFAFIDICRKRYDVALMNPPFGKPATKALEYLKKAFPDDWKDLYAAFFTRNKCFLAENGTLGAITSLLFFYSKQLRELRQTLITRKQFKYAIELGSGVLDAATVDTALSIITSKENARTAFLDLTSTSNKSEALLKSSKAAGFDFRKLNDFKQIYGWPLCYHISDSKIRLWKGEERLEPSLANIAAGNHTFNDFRFLRLFFEVPPSELRSTWVPYEKGGEFQPFFSPTKLVFNWAGGGAEARSYQIGAYGTDAQTIQSISKWFREGLTFPRIGVGFSPRVLPAGCIFSEKGMSIFPYSDDDKLPLLGLLASSWMEDLLYAFGRHRAYENSAVANLPFGKSLLNQFRDDFADLATQAIAALQQVEAENEESPFFLCQAGIIPKIKNIELPADCIERVCCQIDHITSKALFPEDERPAVLISIDRAALFRRYIFNPPKLEQNAIDNVSWCFGVAFGRWDIRYASGEREAPDFPDPFAPLPICPPGQLQNFQDFPACPEDVPSSYPIHIPWDGILVDDSNHSLDIESRVRQVIGIIWDGNFKATTAEAIEQETYKIIGVKTLREYFRKTNGFFADHLKRYSKSRRQAPIYWQLSAANENYSVWLYYHRFTQDTLYRVLRDFVEPRIQQAERESFELEFQGATISGEAANRLHEAQTLIQDLRILKTELDLVAPLWNPNLNDGVIINHAILWRITPYTPWQKKCNECWEKLVKGDYDWAHLAFHLWPERVIPKCTTDRSLAIAHGFDERLWHEASNGNWLPLQLNEEDLQALIAEYTNPSVKSALERFLAAPPPVAPAKKRAKRASSASPRKSRSSSIAVDPELVRQVLLILTAAPDEGLSKNAIAELLGVEPTALTAVIKHIKTALQIEQLGAARGAKYKLTEQGRTAIDAEAGVET